MSARKAALLNSAAGTRSSPLRSMQPAISVRLGGVPLVSTGPRDEPVPLKRFLLRAVQVSLLIGLVFFVPWLLGGGH